jgi:zinc and cadmium transporter
MEFEESKSWLLGFGVFLGVMLHKPLDSLTITTVMAAGGWSPKVRQIVNIGFSLICPIGAAAFYVGMQQLGGNHQDIILAAALAVSAGVFLVISLSDLLPEVQFHSHDRGMLTLALLLGVGLAYLIGFAEHGHPHGEPIGMPHVHDAPPGERDHGNRH